MGGVKVSFYNIEADKLMCSLQKGWEGQSVRDFLLEQPETSKVTWDSQEYNPVDALSGGGLPPKKKKAKKAKKAKGEKAKEASAAPDL